MTGVMTMCVSGVAVQAEVVVITLNTRDEFVIGKRHNTGVAGVG